MIMPANQRLAVCLGFTYDGDQVVIRGIEAKLNQVLVNGIQMPSTDMSDRATNLVFISSNMPPY